MFCIGDLTWSLKREYSKMFGDLQKGNLDLRGAEAAVEPYEEDNPWGIRYIIRQVLTPAISFSMEAVSPF